jgi:tellurite resistance protein
MSFQAKEAFQHIVWSGDDKRAQPLLVAELALWSAMSDGEVEEHELATIIATVQQIPNLEDFSRAEADAILTSMLHEFDDEDRMIAHIQRLTSKIDNDTLRRVAYQLAVYCASSDGMFTDAESGFLEGIREEFGIPGAEAKRLIEEAILKE